MKDSCMLDVNDVMRELGRSRTFCYSVIRELNEELKQQGVFTIRGRIPAKYFYDRIQGEAIEATA